MGLISNCCLQLTKPHRDDGSRSGLPVGLLTDHREFLRLFRTGTYSTANPPGTFFQTSEYIQPLRDEGTDFFPTASLSGPIIKDRVWFFANYSPQFLETIRNINYITNDPRTRAVRAKIRVGDAPAALTLIAGGVWVANFADRTLMRIDADVQILIGRKEDEDDGKEEADA